MNTDHRSELARISGALVRALGHAQGLAARGDFGAELVELLRHARDLHALALETLGADSDPPTEARDLAKAIGDKLADLEAEFAMQRPPSTLN